MDIPSWYGFTEFLNDDGKLTLEILIQYLTTVANLNLHDATKIQFKQTNMSSLQFDFSATFEMPDCGQQISSPAVLVVELLGNAPEYNINQFLGLDGGWLYKLQFGLSDGTYISAHDIGENRRDIIVVYELLPHILLCDIPGRLWMTPIESQEECSHDPILIIQPPKSNIFWYFFTDKFDLPGNLMGLFAIAPLLVTQYAVGDCWTRIPQLEVLLQHIIDQHIGPAQSIGSAVTFLLWEHYQSRVKKRLKCRFPAGTTDSYIPIQPKNLMSLPKGFLTFVEKSLVWHIHVNCNHSGLLAIENYENPRMVGGIKVTCWGAADAQKLKIEGTGLLTRAMWKILVREILWHFGLVVTMPFRHTNRLLCVSPAP